MRRHRYLTTTTVLLLPVLAQAQPTPAATPPWALLWFVLAMLGLVLVVFMTLLVALVVLLKPQLRRLYELPTVQASWSGRVLGLLVGDARLVRGTVRDELLDHDYDGIHEFDNDLPPWWKYGFYLTILFAVAYVSYYHVARAGQLQGAEYAAEMQQATQLVAATNDDPSVLTTYQPLTTPADLGSGKTIFQTNCAPCHGAHAEGKVGPNLTDDYWLHGGEVNQIYKTVRFGVLGKGMVAWKGKLSGKQLLQVSSYILSLQGTRPANAKEPQGRRQSPGNRLARL